MKLAMLKDPRFGPVVIKGVILSGSRIAKLSDEDVSGLDSITLSRLRIFDADLDRKTIASSEQPKGQPESIQNDHEPQEVICELEEPIKEEAVSRNDEEPEIEAPSEPQDEDTPKTRKRKRRKHK